MFGENFKDFRLYRIFFFFDTWRGWGEILICMEPWGAISCNQRSSPFLTTQHRSRKVVILHGVQISNNSWSNKDYGTFCSWQAWKVKKNCRSKFSASRPLTQSVRLSVLLSHPWQRSFLPCWKRIFPKTLMLLVGWSVCQYFLKRARSSTSMPKSEHLFHVNLLICFGNI